MQDLTTGHMVPLDISGAEAIIKQETGQLATRLAALQLACDKAIPDRSKHGPIFQVGEILIIRGGRFEVLSVTKAGLVLKGLPTKGL